MHGAVHAQLKDDLLQGAFQPGDALREVALAERFGVSRTPVREALTRLLHEGLLERRARGLFVKEIDPEQIMQVYDLRILLEGQSAQESASVRTEVDLVRLQALVDRDRALAEPDDDTRLATNIEFHRALWRAAHNPVLEDLLERLATHQIHAPIIHAVRRLALDRIAGRAPAHRGSRPRTRQRKGQRTHPEAYVHRQGAALEDVRQPDALAPDPKQLGRSGLRQSIVDL